MFLADAIFAPGENGDLVPLSTIVPETTNALPPTDIAGTLLKMLLTLGALIALLFATYWFLRRIIQNRQQKGAAQPAIEILEKRMVSPKTMLYLIQIENKKVLFAESQLEIKVLESLVETTPETDLEPQSE